MAERKRTEITEAAKLKALAHPLRWRLLEVIATEGTATATRCSAITGESVANCSYHLNTLAKYGFVETAEGQGREKPWRVVDKERSYSTLGTEDIEFSLAAESATEAYLEHEFSQIRDRMRRHGGEPEPWRAATGLTGVRAYLTAAETKQLRADLEELLTRYADRRDDPTLRPDGARSVSFFLSTAVLPETP